MLVWGWLCVCIHLIWCLIQQVNTSSVNNSSTKLTACRWIGSQTVKTAYRDILSDERTVMIQPSLGLAFWRWRSWWGSHMFVWHQSATIIPKIVWHPSEMIIPWTSGSGDTRIKPFSRVFVNLLPVSMVESPINPTAFSCQKHRKTAPKSYRSASSCPHGHDLGQGLKTSFVTLIIGTSELKCPPYPTVSCDARDHFSAGSWKLFSVFLGAKCW